MKPRGQLSVQAKKLGTFPNVQITKCHDVICTTQRHTNNHPQLNGN